VIRSHSNSEVSSNALFILTVDFHYRSSYTAAAQFACFFSLALLTHDVVQHMTVAAVHGGCNEIGY